VTRLFRPRPLGTAGPALSAFAYTVVIVAAVIAVVPFLYILSTSLKQTTSLFHYPPQWIPSPLFFGNYGTLIHEHPYLRWMLNSLLVSTVVTVIKLLIDSMAGYAFAKMHFPGRNVLFLLVLATLMIPFSAILIPLFFLVRDIGLLNTYWALILPPLASPIGIFMMRTFIEGLPSDLEHAARLDGCSEFAVYWRVILPLIKPGLVVLGIFTFMTQYTSFVWPLVAASDDKMRVLTTGISSLRAIFTTDWGLISAAGVLAMVPITLLFIGLQRYFIAGSLAGALKQ
jgi:ABC-type glycerol-3-phosphate transport system permease component